MINLEVVKTKKTINDGQSMEWDLAVINGILDPDSEVSYHNNKTFQLNLKSDKVIDELCKYSFADLREMFTYIGITRYFKDIDLGIWIILYLLPEYEISQGKNHHFEISIDFFPNNWTRPYSMANFISHFEKEVLEGSSNLGKSLEGSFYTNILDIRRRYDVENLSERLGEVYYPITREFERVIRKIIANLENGFGSNVLSNTFIFPDSIKTACEQYLLYFAQFLNDLGIEANTEIKKGIKGTLFNVVPKNPNEAIERIHEALEFYLKIPAIEGFEVQTNLPNQDISVIHLQAQVGFLNTQLRLNNATLQAKEATIQYLNATIGVLDFLNNEQQALLREVYEPKQNESDILPGVVAIKNWDWGAFNFKFAEIMEKLKRRLL